MPNQGEVESTLDAIVSSPVTARSMIKTPNTTGRLRPGLDEMHPSKVQQSTTKQPDSGLRLGFVDIVAPHTTSGRSKTAIGVSEETPTRMRTTQPHGLLRPPLPPSSPGFDFKFARRGPELGPEAQKMMDDLREEANRIKAELAAKAGRDRMTTPNHIDGGSGVVGRKMAKPKGRAGRFSEIHMAEFKKMDSIAAHPSAHRTLPMTVDTHLPSTSSSILATPGALKRSKSQAKLDEVVVNNTATNNPTRPVSHRPGDHHKRVKIHVQDDTSSTRPTSRGVQAPATMIKRAQLPSGITTPTKASLARCASVKQGRDLFGPGMSRIPRSASTRRHLYRQKSPVAKAVGSESDHRPLLSSFTGLGNHVKSILRRPRLFSRADDITVGRIGDDGNVGPTSSVAVGFKDVILDQALPPLPSVHDDNRRINRTKPKSAMVVHHQGHHDGDINNNNNNNNNNNKPVTPSTKHVTFNIEGDGGSTSPSTAVSMRMKMMARRDGTPEKMSVDPMSSSPILVTTAAAAAASRSQQSPSMATLSSPIMVRYPTLPAAASSSSSLSHPRDDDVGDGSESSSAGRQASSLSRPTTITTTSMTPQKGNFTFSAGKSIRFGEIARSVNKNLATSVSGGHGGGGGGGFIDILNRGEGSTIRQVRSSIIIPPPPAPAPVLSFPRVPSTASPYHSGIGPATRSLLPHLSGGSGGDGGSSSQQYGPGGNHLLPAIPHGMSNKKRHRSDLDDSDSEFDNHGPGKKKEGGGKKQMMMTTKTAAKTTMGGDGSGLNSSDQENHDPLRKYDPVEKDADVEDDDHLIIKGAKRMKMLDQDDHASSKMLLTPSRLRRRRRLGGDGGSGQGSKAARSRFNMGKSTGTATASASASAGRNRFGNRVSSPLKMMMVSTTTTNGHHHGVHKAGTITATVAAAAATGAGINHSVSGNGDGDGDGDGGQMITNHAVTQKRNPGVTLGRLNALARPKHHH